MQESINIHWFQSDLRLEDNHALAEASKCENLLLIYVHNPNQKSKFARGAASSWWLHHSLLNLQNELRQKNQKLFILQGEPLQIFKNLINQFTVKKVTWNGVGYNPHSQQELDIENLLKVENISHQKHYDNFLIAPDSLRKEDGTPYKVYTAFWNAYNKSQIFTFQHSHIRQFPPLPTKKISSIEVQELNLLSKFAWYDKLTPYWQPSEQQAQANLKKFLQTPINSYKNDRDMPAMEGTSQLSTYLHFGQISPKTIWAKLEKTEKQNEQHFFPSYDQFRKELIWREFSYHLLNQNPEMPYKPLIASFEKFPAQLNLKFLTAWQKGITGYPIVDAGMRQLWETGWMHNRVRMIVASFLIKDLLLPWQEGAKWFWDTLIDADLASNSQGWQWTAGCGADAAPFFRVFNPSLQSQKFDPTGSYIRRWIPELSKLSNKSIHEPWLATPVELLSAGITLGKTYPKPIVDHKMARLRALEAFKLIKQ